MRLVGQDPAAAASTGKVGALTIKSAVNPVRHFRRIKLFQAPILTAGHKWVGTAALLGACFVVSHLVTVAITCVTDGFNWGVNAWMMDTLGFLAGLFFAIQCGLSSNRRTIEFRSGNTWICVWAFATFGARILDTMMLFGVVKWGAVYITPTGATLWSNILSEVIIGGAFTITALVGSMMLLTCSQDTESSVWNSQQFAEDGKVE